MFDLKWGIIPAAAAFALAMLVSFTLAQAGFGTALLRAFVFAAVFFGIGCAARALIGGYLPELLNAEDETDGGEASVFPMDLSGAGQNAKSAETAASPSGSNINITLDDEDSGQEVAFPPMGMDNSSSDENPLLGNAAGGSGGSTAGGGRSGDIDQSGTKGYNSGLAGIDFTAGSDESGDDEAEQDTTGLGDFSSFFGGFTGRKGAAENDNSLAELFESFPEDEIGEAQEEAPKVRKVSSVVEEGKKPENGANFSPKEIAMGIQTVLAKEKRG